MSTSGFGTHVHTHLYTHIRAHMSAHRGQKKTKKNHFAIFSKTGLILKQFKNIEEEGWKCGPVVEHRPQFTSVENGGAAYW